MFAAQTHERRANERLGEPGRHGQPHGSLRRSLEIPASSFATRQLSPLGRTATSRLSFATSMPTNTGLRPSLPLAPALFDPSSQLAQPFGVFARTEAGDLGSFTAFLALALAVCRPRAHKIQGSMFTVKIEHAIRHFETWKAAFDRDPTGRKQSGVRRYRVFRPMDDPGYVIIDLDFDGAPEARAFLETMRKVWSRAELSPALLREPGAAAASPQARIVQEIESRDY